jgi:pimeloyl-ACP methyl ester carboxylesterase
MDLAIHSVRPPGQRKLHPLLFVHGAWHGAWCWERFVPWFAARGWECHAVDLRGHGRSPNPRSLRRTRIRDYVTDLGIAVDSLDRPPIVIAHSMGALVTQRFLEERELPGAVLIAPVPLGGVTGATLRTVRRHPLKFLKANLLLDLKPLIEDRDIAKELFLPDDIDPIEAEAVWRRLQSESYLAYLDMLLFVRARPPLVSSPVAIVAATDDRLFTLSEQRRTARAYGVDPIVITGAHDLMLGPRWEAAAAAVAGAAERF